MGRVLVARQQPNSSSEDALVQLLGATGELGGVEGWAGF